MPKPVLRPQKRTNPLVWCMAVICAIIAVVVITGGIVVFVGYLVIRPKMPQISVARAQLNTLYFDEASLLTVQVSVAIKAENDNAKAGSSFYDMNLLLSFQGVKIAYLRTAPFHLNSNSSAEFNFVPQSSPIPLNPAEAEAVSWYLRQKLVTFDLNGRIRTRWRVGPIGSVKNWLHLDCPLHLPTDGTIVSPTCISSKSK